MDVDVESCLIGHLGIVAGIFDALNIAEVIDEALPKKSSRNLPHSAVIKVSLAVKKCSTVRDKKDFPLEYRPVLPVSLHASIPAVSLV